MRRCCGAEREVAQVPRRVRRVQQRQRIAHASAAQRIESRALASSELPDVAAPRSRSARCAARDITTTTAEAHAPHAHALEPRLAASSPRSAPAGGARRSRGCSGPGSAPPAPTRARPAAPASAGPIAVYSTPRSTRRRPRRHAELQRRHATARAHHARELAHRRRRIIHVAQQISERQRVEARVRERQRLRLALRLAPPASPALGGEARARRCEHLRALVDAHHRAVRPRQQLGRDHARAGRHVQYPLSRPRRNRAHQRATPARVLPEAQRRRQLVIAARQAAEQLQRLALARRALSV